jgi:hypothetical protein
MSTSLRELTVPEFAVWTTVNQGPGSFQAYLVSASELSTALAELEEELATMEVNAVVSSARSAEELIEESRTLVGTVLVDACGFETEDWSLLDRRRSTLQPGTFIFVTTPQSFDTFMRAAPHLSSFFGANVFTQPDSEHQRRERADARAARLASLRAWSGMNDDEVIARATAKTLARDPEYAEWLVLLGRGDLLDE